MTRPDSAIQSRPRTLVLDAASVADTHTEHRPGRLVVRLDEQGATTLAAGTPDQVGDVHADPAGLEHHRLPDHVLTPGLVNAHTHLDLTAIGPRPFDPVTQPFADWLSMVVRERPTSDADIDAAIALGVEKSLAGGVVAVGDIAGATAGLPNLRGWRALRESPIAGVSYLEYFAVGPQTPDRLATLEATLMEASSEIDPAAAVRLGLSPHAPYSVEPAGFDRALELAARHALPISTHLSESRSELDLLASGTGPMASFLETIGAWHETTREALVSGRHPVAHLEGFLDRADPPALCAHVNHAGDDAVATLARTRTPVAWCPRSARYFGNVADLGPHPARRLLDAGVPLCVATDSIINLDTPGRISPLDDARLAFAEHGLEPHEVFAAITTTPAAALGLDPAGFAFTPGAPLTGLAACEGGSLREMLSKPSHPALLLLRNRCALAGTREADGLPFSRSLEPFLGARPGSR